MDIKKTLRLVLISAVLLGLSSVSQAIPTLSFGGDLVYESSTGELSLDGALVGSESIIPAPDIVSSTISMSTTWITSYSGYGVTVGDFGSGSIQIDDNTTGADSLLTGYFTSAQMGGVDGNDNGVLSLVFSPTGGTLLSYFSDPSDLFALTLNLDTTFGEGMFGSSFAGSVNGAISSRKEVYEPGMFSLFLVGVGLIAVSGWSRRRTAVRVAGK